MHVLIVDDSMTTRSIIKRMLNECGYQFIEAENGKIGLEMLLKQGPFELALVDWNMPEMNGIEFVRAVRQESAYDDMQIMMVTTETEISRVMEALNAGANEYVMKPFSKEVLLEKLKIIGFMEE